jgi:DNA-binding transcriptional regulator YhcF (GntR family)
MTHTHAFKPLKKVGEIKTIRKEETQTKTESTEQDFKTWLNEKTNKKWDVNKLKALGLSDEEIADLLNGEADDEVCSIS